MTGTCIGGLEAVEFFERLSDRITDKERETYEKALNRIRYEAPKGIGVKIKITTAVNRGHRDFQNCGNCGYNGVRAQEHYCPNCGTAYLRNEYTERKVKQFETNHQITLEEILAGGA